jgi:chemotaxis protein MotB
MRGSRGAFSDKFNVWPGFTDIMVGLLLVFVFVVTLFTITQTVLSRNLSQRDTELHRLQKELSLKGAEMDRLSAEISRLEKLFQGAMEKSTSLDDLLKARNAELGEALAQLQIKGALIEEGNKELDAARKEVTEKTASLEEKDLSLATQRRETESALARLQESTGLLAEKEKQTTNLGLKLKETGEELSRTRRELSDRTASVGELKTKIDALNQRLASLNEKISSYVVEINRLNKLVAESKESEVAEKTRASSLQKEITSLRSRLDEISAKLAKAQENPDQQFRLSQLVNLLGQKDQEIDRLRKLSKYRSEFLAKLEQVFSGVSDIKVQGDRFVFQSEILFASGRTEINESGKAELDKFVRIYNEMVPKIPSGLDMIILVQGHTDTDPVRSARFKSNWELSAARSMQVVRYLMEKGIPPTRLGASALGEFHPVANDTAPEDKRLNRRIEIKITTL